MLTSNGYSLVTPFPGASNSASGSLGASSTGSSSAASVSGAAVPTSFYITGNRGISTFMPGNFTGNPAIGGGVAGGTSGGLGLTIQVGSGSDQAGGSVSTTPAASHTNPADGGRNAPIMAYIGMPTTAGSGTPVLPANQIYPTASAPVPALPPLGQVIPGSPMGTSAGSVPGNPLNPQGGAPMFKPGTTSLVRPLPGSLGISGGLLSPMPSSSN